MKFEQAKKLWTNRKKWEKLTEKEKKLTERLEKYIANKYERFFPHPLKISRRENICITLSHEYCTEYKYGYKYKCDQFFSLNLPPKTQYKITMIDGITTILIGESQKIGNCETWKQAYIAKKLNQYLMNHLEPCVVMIAGDFAAHEKTVEECKKTIKRKIAAQKKKAEKLAEFQSGIITAETYQQLTGACTAGTNAWLADHNLTRADKMTATEFWAKFKNESFFGKEKFRKYFGF